MYGLEDVPMTNVHKTKSSAHSGKAALKSGIIIADATMQTRFSAVEAKQEIQILQES